jgi:hypothetical protein
MFFRKSGYFDESHQHSFIDKLEGLAKFGGIITAGLVTAGPLLSRAGGALGEVISQDLSRGVNSRLAKWGFRTVAEGSSLEAAVRYAANHETQAVLFGTEQLQKNIATTVANMDRIEGFLGGLESHVAPESKTAYSEVKSQLADYLHAVGRAGSVKELEDDAFLDPFTLNFFNEQAEKRGIQFSWHGQGDTRAQERIFKQIVADTSKRSVNKTEISAFTSTVEQRETIIDFLTAARNEHAERTKATNRLFGKNNLQEIQWRQVANYEGNTHYDPQLEAALEKTLENVGMAAPEGQSRVQSIIQKARDNATKLFSYSEGGGLYEHEDSVKKVMDLFETTTTGFYLDKRSGQAVSMAQFRNVKNQATGAFINNFQVPLIPYFFNAPAKMATIMNQTTDVIQNIGHLSSSPELRRMQKLGVLNGDFNNHTQLLGMGGKVLAITPGENPSLSLLSHNFLVFNTRDNPNIARLSDVRAMEVTTALDEMHKFAGDSQNRTTLQNKLSATQRTWAYLSYSKETGMNVHPVSPLFSPLVKKLHGTGVGVPYNELHPGQLAEFIAVHGGDMAPEDLNSAFQSVLKEASKGRIDISEHLIDIERNMTGSMEPEGYGGALRFMMRNSGDARGLTDVINTPIGATQPITDMTSRLYHNASDQLFQTIGMLRTDQASLGYVTAGEGGVLHNISTKLMGESGISQSMARVQDSLVAEVLHQSGRVKIDSLGGEQAVSKLFQLLQDPTAENLTEIKNMPISKALQRLGYFDGEGNPLVHELTGLVGGVAHRATNGTEDIIIRHKELAELGTALLDKHEILNISESSTVQAKLINHLRLNLDDIPNISVQTKNRVLGELYLEANVSDTVNTRFVTGRPFHPHQEKLNPLNNSRYYVTPYSGPSVSRIVNDPNSLIESILHGGGLGSYMRSLMDPHTPLGPLGMLTNMMVAMPQDIGNKIGLGLRGADRVTALRTSLGFVAKRVLPLYAGYEAYKNLNSNMHSMGMPGLDDTAANFLANFNLLTAGIKDTVGLTGLSQSALFNMPGLDQYFHPRSRQEYEDYLAYGDEAVRSGRGWVIGSRTPLTGENVKYYRPNFFRRWKSHWTEADNVDISNAEHSWLPNLENPFAPVARLLNPDWWVKKHRSDRPYIDGGAGVGRQMDDGTYLTINSDGSYGPMAVASLGLNLPIKMTGGGQPINLMGGGSGRGSGGGHGSGGGRGGRGPATANVGPGSIISGGQGDRIHLGFHKDVPRGEREGFSLWNMGVDWLEAARSQMGMYGAMMQRIPLYPQRTHAFEVQDPKSATNFNRMFWMGDYGELTGEYGEFFRRFIQPDNQAFDAYNPLPNNMPSWLPEKYHSGDPYMRTEMGELNLPGDAYERTHPWVAPLRVRGSSIGFSEEELIEKWLNPTEPLSGPNADDIVEFGSKAHLDVQRRLNNQGLLLDAEVSIYDKEHNISGTIDALIRGESGAEVLDIKTQGSKSWGTTPDKYIDQITAYMAITGIPKGHLAFVNRDDPDMVRIESFDFDPERWQNILNRVERARNTVHGMVDKGMISPFETYDLLSRIEILAKVAPESSQFREAVQYAQESGGFGGEERHRFQKALSQAKELRKQYNLYPRLYGIKTESQDLRVDSVEGDGTIITEAGAIKLAGVKWDAQAFVYEDAEEVLARFGIKVGRNISVTLMEGQFNPEVMADTPLSAIVGSANRKLIHSEFAEPDTDNRDPLGHRVVGSSGLLGRAWEWMVHSDGMVQNKFMRVRTGIEQFERGEVFGTDDARWGDFMDTMVKPTISSFIAKDPITAGLQSGLVAGMFWKTKEVRMKAGMVGAAIGASLSVARGLYESATGHAWTPKRYKKKTEFDEYWDMIEYIKYSGVAEAAKTKAKKYEDTDIDRLSAGTYQSVGLGPWGVIAVNAQKKAESTMYGFQVAEGTLQQALQSIPRRHRQIAEELVTSASIKEKQRFYDLLPDSEKRVLGKFLGVEEKDLPDKPKLSDYFKDHFLPDVDWGGWSNLVDDNDLEARAGELENIKIDAPSRSRVDKAKAYTKGVSIPRMDHPTYGNIKRKIRDILDSGGFDGIEVNYAIKPSNSTVVNVDMDLFENQTHELLREMREDADRG